jgi:uncharacterized protein YdeI (YjbR/CyaY-like superfamily)
MAEVSPGVLHELPDFIKKAILEKKIHETWESLTPIQRNEYICWVTMAKKEETKQKRLGIMVENLSDGKKNPCCWPGCPHRRESAKKWFK